MKRFLLAFLIPTALVCAIALAAQTGASLKPTYLKGKWGFADSKGTFVIPARFDAALPFKDGLAKVGLVDEELPEIDSRPNIKWGYIDEKGTVVVDLNYFAIKEFTEDLAAIAVIDKDQRPYLVYGRSLDYANVKWGYVDRSGKTVIPPGFADAGNFSEGLAAVNTIVKSNFSCESPRNYGYIDKSGSIVIEPHFASATEFHNGRASVWIGSVEFLGRCLCCAPQFKGKSGFIDPKGNFTEDSNSPALKLPLAGKREARPMKLPRVLAIACLLALFALSAITKERTGDHPGLRAAPDAKGKWGFIDATGHYRIPPQFDGASEFSDGVAYIWVWNHWDKKVGIVDTTGKVIFFPPQEYEFTFHDGLAHVQVYGPEEGPEKSRTGYIDKTGRVVIKHQFSNAGDFSEGLAWVYAKGKNGLRYGFIDKTGKFAIDPQFDHQPGNFVEGLAKLEVDGKIGFIDRTGKFRIPPRFLQTDDSFSGGLIAVIPDDGSTCGVYIDRDGKIAFEIPSWKQRTQLQSKKSETGWQTPAAFSEGLAPFVSFNQFGFVDNKGKTIIAPEFRGAKSFSEGAAPVRIVGNTGIYLWGYVDHSGKLVIEPQFFNAEPFAGGLAHVTAVEGPGY